MAINQLIRLRSGRGPLAIDRIAARAEAQALMLRRDGVASMLQLATA